MKLLNVPLQDQKALIWYLGHSGWAMKTPNHFLIFDYADAKSGLIEPEDLKNEKVVVFASHQHYDHYDPSLHRWADTIEDITYVYGWQSIDQPHVLNVEARANARIGDIDIATSRSTDEGVTYLVKVDGLTLFHAGDHADWVDNDPNVSYKAEIDHIASQTATCDVAFLPVTSFMGIRAESITQGAIYAILKLMPGVVFPMHGNGRENLYKDFEADARANGLTIPIICAETPGTSWSYPID